VVAETFQQAQAAACSGARADDPTKPNVAHRLDDPMPEVGCS